MGKDNQSFKEAIKTYLDQRAKDDSLFATTYAKPNKNIDECCGYIIGEAKKRGGNAVAISDNEVYGMAVHYYDEDDIKVEKQSNYKVTTSPDKSEKEKQPKGQPLPKEETPVYSKHKGKKKEIPTAQFLLFDEL